MTSLHRQLEPSSPQAGFGLAGPLLLCFLCSGALALAGCATVEVHEKGELAEPQMQLRREGKLQFFEDHALSTLEQAEGANGKAGSGCGCR